MEGSFGKSITIVGLGLIGASYAMALKRTGAVRRIYGIDLDEEVLYKAKSCGITDKGAVDGKAFLSESDMVIIALYPQDTIRFIRDNAGNFKPGAIITDTCGVKQPIISAAKELLPENVEFIGGHPMAGNEFQGFDAASGELFVNTNYIITPHEGNSRRGILAVERLAAAIGCKCVTKTSSEAHDRMIAFTSQLPHIVAVSMSNMFAHEPDMRCFTGRSLQDATRVAALNKELWTQAFKMNSTNIIRRIEEMEQLLHSLKKAIEEQDERALGALFDAAAEGKRAMGG